MKLLCALLLGASLAGVAISPAQADELACKEGVEEVTFARQIYVMPNKNFHQLRGELETWAVENFRGGGGHASYDPKTGVHTWTILMSPTQGVGLSAHFSSASREVEVAAENVCWEDQGEWRASWNILNTKLTEWGYRPADSQKTSRAN